MASAFLVKGFLPLLLMWNSSHSFFLHENLGLFNDIARFSSSSLRRTFSSVYLCLSIEHFAMINISSRYAFVFLELDKVRLIAL